MTNTELKELVAEFIAEQPDNDKDDYYGTSEDMAKEVMGWFSGFLQRKGIRIEL